MSLEDLFPRIVPTLESAHVPYMLVGSVISSLHGVPRSTADLDVVIAPTRAELIDLVRRLAEMNYYADEQQALDAFEHRSQFNVIDDVTCWKVDFMFREDSEYGRTAFARRLDADVAGHRVKVSTPEDVLLAKMRWIKMSGSDRQLLDVAGIVRVQAGRLDAKYVEHWVSELGLQKEWKLVKQTAG